MKYTLKKPVVIGEGAPIVELNFREEVCAGDLRGIDIKQQMTWDEAMKIAARLCGQPEAVLNKMSIADAGEVAALVSGFINGGQPGGKTP